MALILQDLYTKTSTPRRPFKHVYIHDTSGWSAVGVHTCHTTANTACDVLTTVDAANEDSYYKTLLQKMTALENYKTFTMK